MNADEKRDCLAVRFALVSHGAKNIAHGVLELRQQANRGNGRLFHDDVPAIFGDGFRDLVEIVHRDRAFETVWSALSARLLPFVHQSLDDGAFLVAGVHKIEILWLPGLQPPAEHRFIEAAAALNVVGMDGETGKIVWHECEVNVTGHYVAIALF